MVEKFSASVAGRHMACPASADLPNAIPGWVAPPRRVGGAADRGTERHEILEKIMELGTKDIEGMGKILTYVGALRKTRRFNVLVEESIKTTWLAQPNRTTVDLCLYTRDEMHILDYKWGAIPVEVEDNEQLLFYGISLAGLAPKAKGITFHILQPYADNYSDWFADTTVLQAFKDKALAAEQRIIAGDHTFGPSDHGCMFCPANPQSRGAKAGPYCPAMLQIHYPKVVDEDAILSL